VKDGKNITILTYGLLLKQAIIIAQRLEEYGLTVRILNMRTLKPVDEVAIINSARETQLIVTIEDHLIPGGLFSIVAETMARFRANCPILPFGFHGKFFKPAYNINDIIEYEELSGAAIASKVIDELKTAGGQYA
jgi:transketolase